MKSDRDFNRLRVACFGKELPRSVKADNFFQEIDGQVAQSLHPYSREMAYFVGVILAHNTKIGADGNCGTNSDSPHSMIPIKNACLHDHHNGNDYPPIIRIA